MTFAETSASFERFSGFGVNHLHQLMQLIVPEGHPLVKDWFLMKWWHVALVTLLYPFLLGNLRVFRFESHSKPVMKYQPIGLLFAILSIVVYLFILHEVVLYLFYDNWMSCQPSTNDSSFHPPPIHLVPSHEQHQHQQQQNSHSHSLNSHNLHKAVSFSSFFQLEKDSDWISMMNTALWILVEIPLIYLQKFFDFLYQIPKEQQLFPGYEYLNKDVRIASILWFFHVSRLALDVLSTLQSTLTRSVYELRSEQSINEIRFTLTHFLVWWTTILYYPGQEVLFTMAVVCLFQLGTILCAFSPGKFIKAKMLLWLLLVSSNFLRLGLNLWNSCRFPASLLVISPPYDINSNVHMLTFYFTYGFPGGLVLNYFMYGRGRICTWWLVVGFLFCAHWPLPAASSPNSGATSGTHKDGKSSSNQHHGHRSLSAAAKALISSKQEEQLRRELERQSELLKAKEKQREKEKKKQPSSSTPSSSSSSSSKGLSISSSSNSSSPMVGGKSPLIPTTPSTSSTAATMAKSTNGNHHHSNGGTPPSSLLDHHHDKTVASILANHHVLYRKCSYYLCSNFETHPREFKVCQRCRSPYCSRECQSKDWSEGNHKGYCKKFVLLKKE